MYGDEPKISLEAAEALAAKVVKALEPDCERVVVAGSVRRRVPEVYDIDIVAIPKVPGGWGRIKSTCQKAGRVDSDGDYVISCINRGGIKIQIFRANERRKELFGEIPSNWGSVLLCRTGSRSHCIEIASRAMAQNKHWVINKGIMGIGDALLASETEEEIYEAVGMEYVEPHKR